MAQYILDNSQFIVKGFVGVGICQALDRYASDDELDDLLEEMDEEMMMSLHVMVDTLIFNTVKLLRLMNKLTFTMSKACIVLPTLLLYILIQVTVTSDRNLFLYLIHFVLCA